jgi:hypothetical protein
MSKKDHEPMQENQFRRHISLIDRTPNVSKKDKQER